MIFSLRFILELKGIAVIIAGQENPLTIFWGKERHMWIKTNDNLPLAPKKKKKVLFCFLIS